MKVSRNTLILVVVGVALLAFSVLMVVFYIGAVNKTPQLEDEIRGIELQLATIPEPDIPGLRDQVEDLLDKIATEAPFPAGPFDKESKYDNKQITNALFEVTDDAYVTLNSLNHVKEADKQIGQGTYRADAYSLVCSVVDVGHADRLIGLLELLEELREDEYPTLFLDGLRFPTGGTSLQFNLAIITQTFEE